MKLVRTLTLAALGLGALGTAAAVGCGGGTVTNGGDGGGKDGSGGGKDTGGNPNPDAGPGLTPPDATGPATTVTTPQNFAIHQLYLGDTDYGGMAGGNKSAWKNMGYNIDGKITTASSTNVCKLPMGGGTLTVAAQTDGIGGIDNSFGENIFNSILASVDPTASNTVLTDINLGDFTLMFDITGLDTTTSQTATGIFAQAFAGGKLATPPTSWDPTLDWPILGGTGLLVSETPTMTHGQPFESAIPFPSSYVVNGTWVSGTPTTISLTLSISGYTLALNINQAVITFDHTMPNHGANGVISGVLKTTDLVAAVKGIVGRIAPSLCMGGTLTSIFEEITDASDIMHDGTNPGPQVTCDAISIGLGFQADVIGQPMEIAPNTCPKADPCNPDASVPACDSGTQPPVDSGSDTGPKEGGAKG
jgi:hypothetical protein